MSFYPLIILYGNIPLFSAGGSWSPPDCVPHQRIALVIPYRNRLPHLQTFIRNIIPFLKRQKKSFTIFLVEQVCVYPFEFNFELHGGIIYVWFLAKAPLVKELVHFGHGLVFILFLVQTILMLNPKLPLWRTSYVP